MDSVLGSMGYELIQKSASDSFPTDSYIKRNGNYIYFLGICYEDGATRSLPSNMSIVIKNAIYGGIITEYTFYRRNSPMGIYDTLRAFEDIIVGGNSMAQMVMPELRKVDRERPTGIITREM